ncbi:MAG: hypothetical protein V3T24_03860 [Longimicrobiales bacterium]
MTITDGFVVCAVTSEAGDLGPVCVHATLQDAAAWLMEFWDDPANPGTAHPRYQPALFRIAEYAGGVSTGFEWQVDMNGVANNF